MKRVVPTFLLGFYAIFLKEVITEVIIAPVNVSVSENQAATLTCSLTGTSEAVKYFSWSYKRSTSSSTVNIGILTSTCKSVVTPINTSLFEYACPSNTQSTWTIKKVTRQNHGNRYQCNVETSSGNENSGLTFVHVHVPISSVTMTVPSSASVTVDQGTSTEFKCKTSGGRPAATVNWYKDSGTPGDSGDDIEITSNAVTSSSTVNDLIEVTSTLVYSPSKNDNGWRIYCTASNINGQTPTVSQRKPLLNVQLHATTPTITNQTEGNLVMMENDSVSMECISSSTRPVAIVTWKKGTQTLSNVQNINSTASDGLMIVRSIVTFRPMRKDDNEIIYCETAIPGQQNKSVAQQRITVYWPPSIPSISTKDFPFLEGQSGKILSCSSIEYGNPLSSALWDSRYGTQDTGDSKILNLPTLNRNIDKGRVSCQLRNHYTQAKGLAVTSPTIIMDVQYKPVVRIVEAGHDVQTVTKIEGENFTATCIAVGNPVPSVRWIGQTSTSSELRFTDIDRKDHGTYTCRAEATSEKYSHHDFVTLRNLSLVVFYTTVQSFYIEEHADQDNVTVDEHDPQIEFKCIVNSNTALTTKIMFEGVMLKQEMNVTSLSFTRQDISCSDAGAYTCDGRNDYGGTSLKTVFLSVRCVPRPKGQIRRNLTGELYSSVTLSFTAIAYPEPGSKGFAWQKEESVGWVPLLSNDHLKISSSGLQSNLTVLNVSEEDYGTYRVTVTNNIGNYVQHLFLYEEMRAQQPDRQCKCQTSDQTALIVGISLGIVCCVLASVATYLAISRIRTVTKESRKMSKTKKQSAYANTSFATDAIERHEYENPATDQEEASNQQQYTALCRYPNTDKDTYDEIKKV